MARWDGFGTLERHEPGRPRLRIVADFGGTDEEPVPRAVLVQTNPNSNDMIDLRDAELLWLVERAPRILERMGQRP